MTDLGGRVVSSLRWQAAAKFGSQVVSWGVTIVVMRLLTPEDYGLMAMTMVLVGLTALVAEMGLGAALVRSPEVTPTLKREVFGLALMVNVALYAALVALAPLSVSVFNEPRLWVLTLAMGLQLPLAALSVVPESMARRELRFKDLSLIELSTQLGAAATTLAGAWHGLGVWALVLGHVAGSMLKTLLLLARFGTVLPRFALQGQGRLMRFGGSLTANRIVWYLSSQADIFIAGKLLGQHLLGVYAVAVNLASMPMQKLMAVSNQVAFSALSSLQTDPDAFNRGLCRSLTLMSGLSIGLLWGLAAVAPELIPLVLGPQWAPSDPALQIISLVVPGRILTATVSTALIAAGHVGDGLEEHADCGVVLIPAFLVGAHLGGLHGLALAWIVGVPMYGVLLLRRAGFVGLGIGFGQMLSADARPPWSLACMLGVGDAAAVGSPLARGPCFWRSKSPPAH